MHHKRHEQETGQLLRFLSLYQCLTYGQAMQLLPEMKEEPLSGLLTRLAHQGRICYSRETGMVTMYPDTVINPDMLAAVWVLLDFLPQSSYHTAGTYPVLLTFFAKEEIYEILTVPPGKEVLINHAMSSLPVMEHPHRLVIVHEELQISKIAFPCITAFCRVQPDGTVQYFKTQGDTDLYG